MPKHAAKTPSGNSTNPPDGSELDDRIGLTEAFSPVGSKDKMGDASEGEPTQTKRDNAIGLTEAFTPVGHAGSTPAHAGGFSYKGDNAGEYPDAIESLEPVSAPPLLFPDSAVPEALEEPAGRHGKKEKPHLPAHQRKSRRMRRILLVVVVLLVLLIAALGYFTFRLIGESQTLATQQTQDQQNSQEGTSIQKGETKDATSEAVKKTTAPDLISLLGKTQEEAVVILKRGATVTSSRDVNEEGNPIKKNVTVALTDEPADTRSGTPTVYLGVNEEGKIVQSGYSASTAALGFGSLSFIDAVKNDSIIEKTLLEAGVTLPAGSVVLPEDKTTYSTYASDGKTLVKENCSFSGTVDFNGVPYKWSSVLTYDYATANTSGNLADTIRIIYVYINI